MSEEKMRTALSLMDVSLTNMSHAPKSLCFFSEAMSQGLVRTIFYVLVPVTKEAIDPDRIPVLNGENSRNHQIGWKALATHIGLKIGLLI